MAKRKKSTGKSRKRPTYPGVRSGAVTTKKGMQMLDSLFLLAMFGRRVWSGLQRKRWYGPSFTKSFARDGNGNRAYTHGRY